MFWIFLALSVPGFLSVLGATIAAGPGTTSMSCPTDSWSGGESLVAGRRRAYQLFFFGLLGGWLGALAWQIASWRQSSGERQQAG